MKNQSLKFTKPTPENTLAAQGLAIFSALIIDFLVSGFLISSLAPSRAWSQNNPTILHPTRDNTKVLTGINTGLIGTLERGNVATSRSQGKLLSPKLYSLKVSYHSNNLPNSSSVSSETDHSGHYLFEVCLRDLEALGGCVPAIQTEDGSAITLSSSEVSKVMLQALNTHSQSVISPWLDYQKSIPVREVTSTALVIGGAVMFGHDVAQLPKLRSKQHQLTWLLNNLESELLPQNAKEVNRLIDQISKTEGQLARLGFSANQTAPQNMLDQALLKRRDGHIFSQEFVRYFHDLRPGLDRRQMLELLRQPSDELKLVVNDFLHHIPDNRRSVAALFHPPFVDGLVQFHYADSYRNLTDKGYKILHTLARKQDITETLMHTLQHPHLHSGTTFSDVLSEPFIRHIKSVNLNYWDTIKGRSYQMITKLEYLPIQSEALNFLENIPQAQIASLIEPKFFKAHAELLASERTIPARMIFEFQGGDMMDSVKRFTQYGGIPPHITDLHSALTKSRLALIQTLDTVTKISTHRVPQIKHALRSLQSHVAKQLYRSFIAGFVTVSGIAALVSFTHDHLSASFEDANSSHTRLATNEVRPVSPYSLIALPLSKLLSEELATSSSGSSIIPLERPVESLVELRRLISATAPETESDLTSPATSSQIDPAADTSSVGELRHCLPSLTHEEIIEVKCSID